MGYPKKASGDFTCAWQSAIEYMNANDAMIFFTIKFYNGSKKLNTKGCDFLNLQPCCILAFNNY